MIAQPVELQTMVPDEKIEDTDGNENDSDSDTSDYTDSDDDESYDSDESSSVASDFLVKEEERQEEKKSGLFLSLDMVRMLRISTSTGDLKSAGQNQTLQKMVPRVNSVGGLMSKMVYAIQTKSPMESHAGHESEESVPKPKDLLVSLLEAKGNSAEFIPYESGADQYVKGDAGGYTLDLMTAVKQGDIEYLRHLQKYENRNFQCSNKFGESIVHAVARQGQLEVLKFLVHEAGVSTNVRCDTGRTPLHDACWTGQPNFQSIEFLLEKCPRHILVKDKRGFTPLEYAPKDSHYEWKEFLEQKQEKIRKLLTK